MFSHTWLDRSGPRGTVQGLCICFQKLFISVTSQLHSSLVVHPPKKNPGSAPALHVLPKKHMTRQLHVFLCLALVTCFPTRLSAYMFSYAWHVTGYMFSFKWLALLLKKGRLQIQTNVVLDFGARCQWFRSHGFVCQTKKRTVILGKSINGSLEEAF